MTAAVCTELGQISAIELPASIAGSEASLTVGSCWVRLRCCIGCGKNGCCQLRPSGHARGHVGGSSHPLTPSVESAGDWSSCLLEKVVFVGGSG
jgi:hypothetical protein